MHEKIKHIARNEFSLMREKVGKTTLFAGAFFFLQLYI